MPNYNGENLTLTDAGKKLNGGEVNGRVKTLTERFTFTAEMAVGEKIYGPSLPADVRVLDAYVKAPSLGATGIFTLGHVATEDREGNVIAEDPNAFVDAADFGGAAAMKRASIEAGIGTRLGKNQEVQTFLECSELTAAAVGQTIEYVIFFTLD